MEDSYKLAGFYVIFVFILILGLIGIFVFDDGVMSFMMLMALIFIMIAVPMIFGKGQWMIAGYNTMNDSERKEYESQYDMKKMNRYLGISMLFFALGFIAMGLRNDCSVLLFLICLAIGILAIVYALTGTKRPE